ncbi:hypothetical protein FC18_GL001444 [Lacticaseibacillus sharpeae JCM 1186 = DSM 20505]|uniref:Uncharacterized protein n=1 Tax=Lacticaseibacillus sharpeae JCM 1186 = DSM 20505 TaxID=1291052 RepID=A0A0R1ZLQ4_9LACO|nr:hypothetical protein FC18_GL001444 [Lacticaseibacillus sharpeae JCM 1186 = DSM 20505]
MRCVAKAPICAVQPASSAANSPLLLIHGNNHSLSHRPMANYPRNLRTFSRHFTNS